MRALSLSFAMAFVCLQMLSIAGADESGPSYTFGVGIAPIYVEERVKSDYLIGGLTVLPIHTQISTGYTLNSEYRIALKLSNDWYLDEQSRLVSSGLLAATVRYSPDDFHGVYMQAGAGLALKNRLSTAEMNQGFGFLLGAGKHLTGKISLELTMRHLSFNELQVDPSPGVSEDISSLQLSLVMLTF